MVASKVCRVGFLLLGLTLLVLITPGVLANTPYLYMTNSYNDSIGVVDLSSNTSLPYISLDSGSVPYGITVNPAGTYAYIVNSGRGSVSVLSLATNNVTAIINVTGDTSNNLRNIIINSAGNKLYVADPTDNRVYVIDLSNNNAVTSISTPGYGPMDLVLNSNGSELWVGCYNGYTLVISTSTYTVTHTISTGTANSFWSSITIDKDGLNIYVADTEGSPGTSHVYKISTSTYTVIATLNQASDTTSYKIAYGNNGYIWETLGNSNKVSMIDTSLSYAANVTVTSPINLISYANNIYVANSSGISIINIYSQAVTGTILSGNGIWGLAIGNLAPENIPVAPHLTLFRVQSFFGIVTYSNVTATVSYTVNGEILYNGLTDDTGSYSCVLYPSQQYTIHFVNATQGIDETLTIFPVDIAYYVNVLPLPGFDISDLFLNGSSQNIETGQSWVLNRTSNVGTIYTTYIDEGNSTTSVNFSLYSKNPLSNTPPVYVSSNVYTPLQPNINVLSFNGVSSYVNVDGSGGVYNSPGGVYSVEAIFKTTSSGTQKVIYAEGPNSPGATPIFMLLKDVDDKLYVFIRFDDLTTKGVKGVTLINDGRFHRASWVDNNGSYILYLDGNVEASGTYTRKTLTVTMDTIGAARRNPAVFFFDGIISDVRLWTTARTEAQVNNYMFVRLAGSESGLKAYYKLDEGTGTTANDLTSNNYDGTINAGTWTTATLRQYLRNVYSISNAGGKEYLVTVNGTSSLYGDNSHSYGVTFPGATVTIGEIPQEWYNYLSYLIIIILAGLGTAVTGPLFLIIVAFAAFVFAAIGWFDPFNSSIVLNSAVALVFLMGLGWYILEKEKTG